MANLCKSILSSCSSSTVGLASLVLDPLGRRGWEDKEEEERAFMEAITSLLYVRNGRGSGSR